MKIKIETLFLSVFFCLLIISCDSGSGNIQGHIDLNLIEHLEGKDLGGTTIKIKGRNEVAVTDIEGNFTLKNVEAGTFTLTISRDDWDTKEAKIKVGNGEIASLNETLDYSFAIITGNIVGMPSNYTVSFVKKDDEKINYQQTTSSDFIITRVEQGSYNIKITDADNGYFILSFEMLIPKNWHHSFSDVYNDEYLQSDNDEFRFKKIAASAGHTCGIEIKNNSLFCWGDNKYGQLGVGTTGGYGTVPSKIGSDRWTDISTGLWHTCGIKESDKRLFCWGMNEFGGLGDGSYDDRSMPTKVDDSSWSVISAGGWHTCGIKSDNSLFCWGRSTDGQVGNGRSGLGADENVPVNIGEEEWLTISTGSRHTCGIRNDNSLYCWGDNENGQLGNGYAGIDAKISVPEKIGNDSWIEISSGKGTKEKSTCGITTDQFLYCWGSNDHGQLGDGTTNSNSSPTKIGDEKWLEVTIGEAHACSINSENGLFCWGENEYGQIGDITENDSVGIAEEMGGKWSSVSAGSEHTCAINTGGNLYCFGSNDYGQIGDGTTNDNSVPVLVKYSF